MMRAAFVSWPIQVILVIIYKSSLLVSRYVKRELLLLERGVEAGGSYIEAEGSSRT